MRNPFLLLGLPGFLALSGCALTDPLAAWGDGRAAPSASAFSGAEVADSACLAEARRQFEVQGLSASTPVNDELGRVVARDVMVQIRRSGRTLDVRCRYDYAAGSARMMVL